jgi:hypothetical protein
MTVETEPKSTLKPHGSVIKKTDIKRLYDLLHKANTPAERDEIMRNAIQFSPEYETVFKNLTCKINNAFTTFYKQFKDILYSFQDSVDDSGNPVQFTIKFTKGSRSRSRSRSNGKSTSPPAMAQKHSMCALPTPLHPSPQNSVSNLSDLKIGLFFTAFLTCDASQRALFIKRYIHATRPNGDSFPEFVDDISSDMNKIIHLHSNHHLPESQLISEFIIHLIDMKDAGEDTDEDTLKNIFILYPLPRIHMNMTRKGRQPSIRNLGGRRRRGKGRKTRKFK